MGLDLGFVLGEGLVDRLLEVGVLAVEAGVVGGRVGG